MIFGGVGAGIAALCCFTPLLVIALAAVGLAGLSAYLDFVLLPLLLVFVALFALGLYQARKLKNCVPDNLDKSLNEEAE